jgi:IS5 family transposase
MEAVKSDKEEGEDTRGVDAGGRNHGAKGRPIARSYIIKKWWSNSVHNKEYGIIV